MNTKPHQCSYRVYYEDTDAGGVVYHTNYLKYAERARTEFLRDQGIEQSELLKTHGVMFVVHRLSIDFKKPAKLDDLLRVESVIASVKKVSLQFKQHIMCEDKIIAILDVYVACIDSITKKPVRITTVLNKSIE